VAQDIGSLEVGKLADIVVLNSNPLEELRSSADLHLVIKGGAAYEADSLNSVWPEEQKLPQQWWQPDRQNRPEKSPAP
jgi:cytosine/adenosine deaminase-related metal-dependent hydrolase